MPDVTGLPLIKAFKSDVFPLDRLDPGGDLVAFLSKILVTEHEQHVTDAGGSFELGLTVADEAVVDLVGLEGFALVLGGGSTTSIRVGVTMEHDRWEVALGAGARLRFPRDVLKPVMRSGEEWVDDPSRAFAELEISAGIVVDSDWDVDVDGSNAFRLDAAMVADSGLVIEGEVALDLSESRGLPESAALGLPVTWRGIVFRSLEVHLPPAVTDAVPVSSLSFTDFHIGTGGVTGSVALNGSPGDGTIGGFPFRPTRLEVELRQNCLVRAEIAGRLTLSFFDEPLDVTAGFDLDGNLTVAVAAADGLVELTKPGIVTVAVDGLRFAHEDGVFLVGVSGTITPLIGGLDWPGFTVQELSLDSEGNVRLEGGWLDLPDQYSLDFYGFHVGIAKIGMGSTDDGGRWIGFSGDIKLVDGLSIGGSVDGLKVTWYDDGRPPGVTLEGVGVELEIPEVLRFRGSVGYRELPGPQRRFDGAITLELLALGLRVDGKIVIGTDTDAAGEPYSFFALYIGVELPAGIPLWATGLGLYGVAGLIAIQMAPNKGPDEEWFENLDGSDGWYKRPVRGVTDLASKWDPVPDGFALGGGVTIGTLPDNGFTFNGSLLLVISFPGPVILLEGKANLLQERASLSDDPIFRALVLLDFRAGEFLVGLDAAYAFGDGGELIEIGGSAEAFFDFDDAARWHLYLGRDEPRERRIRAQVLSLFEANTYFMIDAHKLQTGAWVGYDKRWDFGPLAVVVEAWIEGGVVVSWKPVYFHGHIWLHGKVELRVFGFGLGLHADARFSCDVFDPFHVVAELSVGISLPWPLPDFEVDITLEWGPTPDEPPLPVPLKEIAVEHFKSTASWPLPRADLLLPDVDAGDGYLVVPPPVPDLTAAPPAHAPVVPMDARPHLTFDRAVHDDALVGVNPQPVLPAAVPPGWERVGDPEQNQGPMRVRFAITEIALSRWDGGVWVDEARKAATANAAGVRELYGSWAPVPQLPAGLVTPGTDPPTAQVKLWLWSRSPFDFTVHGGRAWDEWFTDTFPTYPCVPPVPERTVCCDLDDIPAGTALVLPMPCPEHREVVLVGDVDGVVEQLEEPMHGHVHALCWDGTVRDGGLGIRLTGAPASRMRLVLAAGQERTQRRCFALGRSDGTSFTLPLTRDGTTVRVFDRRGDAVEHLPLTVVDGRRGISTGWHAELTLPCATDRVDLLLHQAASPVVVVGHDADGEVVAHEEGPDEQGLVTVVLEGAGITRVLVDAPQDETTLIQACSHCTTSVGTGVQVLAVDVEGVQHGPFPLDGDVVTVDVPGLTAVQVLADGHVCLVEACVTYPPDEAEVAARSDMAERLVDAMALWGDEGEVLHPDSDYRIRLVTTVEAVGEDELAGVSHTHDVVELAYFRTQGPPGLTRLSTPTHHPPGEAFDPGLEDLTRYVHRTVPETGTRPVLRAYDVGVEFDEDYVDLMYRLAKRDLTLYLYDANNQPVRDAQGRLVVAPNRWGVTESVLLSESTVRYLSVIDQATCVATDPKILPHQKTLFAVDPGLVLDPDRAYEARLVPLLLHEDFRDGLGAWTVVDSGSQQGPSSWTTPGHPELTGTGATASGVAVTLTGAGGLAAVDTTTDVVVLSTDTARPSKTYRVVAVDDVTKVVTVDGAPSLSGGSSGWKVPGWGAVTQTANIWGGDDSPAGVPKPGTTLVGGDVSWTDYRFSVLARSGDDDAIGVVFRYVDAQNHYRFAMDRERRYRRLVRCVAGAFTVLGEDDHVYLTDQDHLLTVEAVGTSLRVYVDGSPVFHATDDALPAGRVGLYCWANVAARFSDVRVDDIGPQAPVAYRFPFTTSRFVDVSHHLHGFQDETWVTEAPDLAEASGAVPLGAAPTDAEHRAYAALAAKVLGAAAQVPAERTEVHRVVVGDDAVGLLVRCPEPVDWARASLEVLRADGTVPPPTPPTDVKIIEVATGADPNDEAVTLLARERTTLDGISVESYGIAGPLRDAAPDLLVEDAFARPGGVLLEERFGADALAAYRVVDAPGAVSGPSVWTVSAGAVVQTSNIYAGEFLGTDPARRGTVAVTGQVWSDIALTVRLRSDDDDAIGVVLRYRDDANWYRFSMDRQRAYRRLVRCVDGTVSTLWEDGELYEVGREYEVRVLAFGETLLGYVDDVLVFLVRDGSVPAGQVGFYAFADVGAVFSALRVEALESAPVLVERPAPEPGVLLEPAVTDALVSVRLRSSGAAGLGLTFGHVDAGTWYRFVLDRAAPHRRLVRSVAGVVTVLWEDSVAYVPDEQYALTVRAEGRRLRVRLDGVLLVDVHDPGYTGGRVGCVAAVPAEAEFADLVVTDPVRRIGGWRLLDETATGGPSTWRSRDGVLAQSADVGAGALPGARGTLALTGQLSWSDYRVTVRMRSDDDDGIGVVVRYSDPDNWYRLSFDAQRGFRRLVRCAAGALTTLWEDGGAYTVGQSFTVSVDAVGSRLVGHHGDVLLFDLTDATHGSGQVGLYAWANPGARFEHVTVTRPPLDAYAVFRDRFAAGDVASWTVVDEGAESAPSAWSVTGGELRQSSNIFSNPVDGAAVEKLGTTAVAGDAGWTDVVWTVGVRADDDDAVGFVFRYAGVDDHYRFSMDRERGYRRLVRRAAGTSTTLWQDDVRFETGRRYAFTVASVGSRHTVWVDGVPLLEVDDATHAAGRIGLYTWANQDARFSGVRVYPVDRLVVGDVLAEDFEVAVPGLWSVVTAGDQQGPASWTVLGGELHQTSNVWGGDLSADEPAKPGTVALLTLPPGLGGTGLVPGSESWTDYRVTVRLRSDDDDAVGVVLRYTDEDNWYRLSMDRERAYRRLVRCVDGTVSVLWVDGVPGPLGREQLLTVDAVGDSLVGYVDGVELFSVRDGSHARGTVGLYSWGNTGLHVGSVRVTGAGWSTHHRLGTDEPVLAAGTEVVIRSGDETAWTAPPVPGVAHRFVATAPDAGRRRLPAGRAVDLRLRTPAGETLHARRFLPAAEYAPVPGVGVLRRSDGTELLLVTAGTWAPGQYRLLLTHRRDNTVAVPGSVVQSRAGDRSDEVVVLDVPWSA